MPAYLRIKKKKNITKVGIAVRKGASETLPNQTKHNISFQVDALYVSGDDSVLAE